MDRINKAVFPVAGLGSRFLPATKALPKEMIPIIDKPLIQYAVEEAVRAGITQLVFVTNHTKRAIEDHFERNLELESRLHAKGKSALAACIEAILPDHITCVYLRQPEPLGLGHAILCAEPLIGNEPFAVLLADDLIQANANTLEQMIQCYHTHQASMIAVMPVPNDQLTRYGVIKLADSLTTTGRIAGLVEKPTPACAPSNYGIVGRYILTSHIFQKLRALPCDSKHECQLTDALANLLPEESLYAFRLQAKRYDCGDKLEYLKALIAFGLHHPELGERFTKYLHSLTDKDRVPS